MSWLIQINGGDYQSFTELGCAGLRRELRSQTPGTFTFRMEVQEMDAAPIAEVNDLALIVWNDGVTNHPFFAGRVTKIPVTGSASAEDQSYEISDAWSDFERITFQQQWTNIAGYDEEGAPNLAYLYRSEGLLGVDAYGNTLSSAQVIEMAVNWAISVGADCQLGTILQDPFGNSVAAPVPVDEISDLPVAEIIKKMMRLTPDAVAWFDYSTSPPSFHVTRQAQCTPTTVPFTQQGDGVSITARTDLQRPEVVIRYIQENQTTGEPPQIVTIVDAAPAGADGLAFGALVATVRLAGSSASYQKQAVTTTPIPQSAEDDNAVPFLQLYHPWLRQFSADRLEVTSLTVTVDSPQNDDEGNAITDLTPGDYPNALLTGTIAKWMQSAYPNLIAARVTVTAQVSYEYPDDTDDESALALTYFGPADGNLDNWDDNVQVLTTCKGTNASTQVYEQLSRWTQAEPAPTGLAAILYSAVSTLQYEGTWNIIQSEAAWYTTLGITLNISGAEQTEWAAMNALVQEIADDLDSGRSTYVFGPGNLAIQDLMEQLRPTRHRTESYRMGEQQTGQPTDAGLINGPGHAPELSGSLPPTPTHYPWIDFVSDQENDDGSGATWSATLGYGEASFSNYSTQDRVLEQLEISVGNDGSGWSGPDYDSDALFWGLSLIVGDDTADNDQLLIARSDSDGGGGSMIVTPYNPSIDLSPNLDGSIGDDDQFIKLHLESLLIRVQDTDGSFAQMDANNMLLQLSDGDSNFCKFDLSGDPYMQVWNQDNSNYSILDDNSLTCYDDGTGGTIDADASDIANGKTASMIVVGTDSDGNDVYALATDPFAAWPPAPSDGNIWIAGCQSGTLQWYQLASCGGGGGG